MIKNFFTAVCIFLLITFFNNFAFAQNNESKSVNELFAKFDKLVREQKSLELAVDYAIEILKNHPASIEAYFVINDLFYIGNDKVSDELMNKYELLKSNHWNDLNNIENNVAEKIVFMNLVFKSFYHYDRFEEAINNNDICDSALRKIKTDCSNKLYAMLATVTLFKNRKTRNEEIKYFIQNFPDHPAIFYAEYMLNVLTCLENKEPQKGLEQANIYLKKYGEINTPRNYKFKYEAYSAMVSFYIQLKDQENAHLYYNLILKGCPGHYDMPGLREEMELLK